MNTHTDTHVTPAGEFSLGQRNGREVFARARAHTVRRILITINRARGDTHTHTHTLIVLHPEVRRSQSWRIIISVAVLFLSARPQIQVATQIETPGVRGREAPLRENFFASLVALVLVAA